jgi:hypothetical protein
MKLLNFFIFEPEGVSPDLPYLTFRYRVFAYG